MVNISQVVEDILSHDDIALGAARRGWLNLSSYARAIQPEVEAALIKPVSEGSIITALSRITSELPAHTQPSTDSIQGLSVHSNLEGMTFERSEELSQQIRDIYREVAVANKAFIAVTQGVTEVTIVASSSAARIFRDKLEGTHKIYDKQNLVGITVKFALENLEMPNLIFALTKRLAYKDINIIEIVSTATELTFIIDKADLAVALAQLQLDL